jgi:hypothetical protein
LLSSDIQLSESVLFAVAAKAQELQMGVVTTGAGQAINIADIGLFPTIRPGDRRNPGLNVSHHRL